MPTSNPFTPGQVPRVLAGRSVELRRMQDQIARVVQYAEVGGPLLVFHAPRGIGKTSLLRRGQQVAEEAGAVTVWVACSRGRPFLPELLHALQRSLERADVVPRTARGRRWRGLAEKVSVEVGIPGVPVKLRADLPTAPADEAGGGAPIGALEDLLHDTAALIRERGGAGLLILLDELHAAPADELSVFLNVMQNIDGRRADNPIAVFCAGLPVTPEAITRAATFGERSSFVALDVLSTTDARSVLVEPAEGLGVTWTEPALQAVLEEARGHPYFLQLLGSTTWDAARPAAGDRLGLPDVRRGIGAAKDQIRAMHRARWNSATKAEQAFLRAMARVETPRGNVARAQIAAELGVHSRSISVPRERLIEKGVIEPVGHGLVRFTLPGFGAYLLGLDV